jgi:hypothetical protein
MCLEHSTRESSWKARSFACCAHKPVLVIPRSLPAADRRSGEESLFLSDLHTGEIPRWVRNDDWFYS